MQREFILVRAVLPIKALIKFTIISIMKKGIKNVSLKDGAMKKLPIFEKLSSEARKISIHFFLVSWGHFLAPTRACLLHRKKVPKINQFQAQKMERCSNYVMKNISFCTLA